MTDSKRLQQMLKNLLSNAFKFTERGGVTFTISNGGVDGRVAFEVSDTGIGIPPEKQKLIFEAFQQANSARAANMAGPASGWRSAASLRACSVARSL